MTTRWRATPESYASRETLYLVHVLGHGERHHATHAAAEQDARAQRDFGYNVRTSLRTYTREAPRWMPVLPPTDAA